MRTAIRALAITAAAALTVTGLAACSSGGSGSSGDSKTLTYWASNQGTSLQNDKEVLTPVLKKFTKETGIKVDLQVIGWNDLQNKIQTAVTSGQGPDVVNIGNTWATSLQATGAFQEFGDSEMKAIGGSDKFGKVALSTGGAPGKTVTSVPLYGLAYGLYYNKKMFSDAGIEAPTTWEDLTADAKKLTSGDKYGFTIAGGSYTENSHFAFITSAQNGGEWFDKDGKPTFTQKANVDGIKRYLDLMQSDKVVNPSNAQYDNGTQAVSDFANGKAAMMLTQNNANATITSQGMKTDEFGVVPFPTTADGQDIASFPAGINLSIFKNTKNKDGALKFVKYMTSADTQTTLDKPYSALPVLAAAADSVTDEQTKTFLDIYNNKAKPLPLVPAEDQFESTVGKAMNDMFAKIATGSTVSDSDIKSALQTAQDQVSQAAG
ncbi:MULTISPECIES: ABC transporter substrate-binding protein [unclassified Curtobacterium]|jgi:multiple sugar transport system substrate-binding protein|uniref:ABC transporter substrate-binding protein n=1 Tax=unclassified Curtobacterium TaxID=257496 RepID=UPI00089DFAD7|nr:MULTISPECIES: sugar ABC transporter substrate-binding protein [unclassified Curtobacterium]AOX66675.1 sugar-binding protein [Curtobacterium sp. BH-2-1-1]MCT9621491.1 sugar ABC transporter substrate-binding protein [Curtobacterium sp. C2H10]MDR6172293.1 multiple sugar transport system substrate-binding protein [Curtobacterium sp. SORGH_AS_0776]MDR6571842.1 multiple sugar transport system substrate-binding protein [Curtobacterium sp. 320]OII16327.1 sugar-binding protein [Curtobacterium sp. MC